MLIYVSLGYHHLKYVETFENKGKNYVILPGEPISSTIDDEALMIYAW